MSAQKVWAIRALVVVAFLLAARILTETWLQAACGTAFFFGFVLLMRAVPSQDRHIKP